MSTRITPVGWFWITYLAVMVAGVVWAVLS